MIFGGVAWGDAATWSAALFTGGALVAALLQIRVERRARLAGEARAEEQAERAQAERVVAWVDEGAVTDEGTPIIVRNDSGLPVYRVVVSLVFVYGAAPSTGEGMAELGREYNHPEAHRRSMVVLPPGTWRLWVESGWAGMHRRPGAEVAFVDSGGRAWVRRGYGPLERLGGDPFETMDVFQPVTHVPLEPL